MAPTANCHCYKFSGIPDGFERLDGALVQEDDDGSQPPPAQSNAYEGEPAGEQTHSQLAVVETLCPSRFTFTVPKALLPIFGRRHRAHLAQIIAGVDEVSLCWRSQRP